MTKQVIANFLKQLRKTSGLSANDVVEKLKNYNIDISAKTLYGYESGLSMLNADAFVSLCRIYKCDNPMDMFGIPSIKPEEIKHIEKYRSLDPHGQQTVDIILDREAERSSQLRQSQERITELEAQATTTIPLKESPAPYILNAAHTRTDIPDSERTPELAQLDDDIMKNF